MYPISPRILVSALFLWALIAATPAYCQNSKSPLSQIGSWDGSGNTENSQALNQDSDPQDSENLQMANPDRVQSPQQPRNHNDLYGDPDRRRRLYYHDSTTRAVERDRKRVRKAKRNYEKQNKADRDYYKRKCGLGNRRWSRGSCNRLKKQLRAAKESRKKGLNQQRRRIRKRR